MSYTTRLVHTLTHVSTPLDTDTADLDDRGYPTPLTPVQTEVRGLVQPRTARELADIQSAGAEIGDYVIFLPRMTVSPADYFVFDGDRYQVSGGIRDFNFGRSPHLEVDARKVEGSLVEVGS